MTAIGIDVSKGKSTIVIEQLTPKGNSRILLPPTDFAHTQTGLDTLITTIKSLTMHEPALKAVLEATGHYHQPILNALTDADIPTTLLNPLLIHNYQNNSVRKIKTDKADAAKIARYALDNWFNLHVYIPPETIRQQIRMVSRQYNLHIKTAHTLENNLICLLDSTFPNLQKLFTSQKRKDGTQKWVDFAQTFWHADMVSQQTESAFITQYMAWCMQHGYKFSPAKARQIYIASQNHPPMLPCSAHTKLLITTAALSVAGISKSLAALKAELTALAAKLPKYPAVIAMYETGPLTAAQLIAEIGDLRRFHKKTALAAFAGIDPLPRQSGKYEQKSTKTSKRGSPALRRTLFQIVCTYLRHSPEHEAVYQFIDKKRAEGKPYFVYMTAAANKFLRIYYARVLAFLDGA